MSTELKTAAQQAVDAFDAFGDADDFASLFELTRKMHALRTAIQQAEAQQPVTGEPVYWEWRHLSTHPDTVDFGQWSEWKRVEARSAIHTIEDALAEFRAYIAQGYKYELRALYDHPAPSVPADVVRDAIAAVREQYRGTDWGKAAECICDAIDAAMLAAKDA